MKTGTTVVQKAFENSPLLPQAQETQAEGQKSYSDELVLHTTKLKDRVWAVFMRKRTV